MDAGAEAGAAAGELRESGVDGSGSERRLYKAVGRGCMAAGSCWWSLRLKDRQNGNSCALRSSLQTNLTPHTAGKGKRHAFP